MTVVARGAGQDDPNEARQPRPQLLPCSGPPERNPAWALAFRVPYFAFAVLAAMFGNLFKGGARNLEAMARVAAALVHTCGHNSAYAGPLTAPACACRAAWRSPDRQAAAPSLRKCGACLR